MNFWADKNVVVTGGAGFVGSHLVEELLRRGAKSVLVLDNYSRGDNKIGGVDYLYANVACEDNRLFEEADVVFNLAAHVAGVDYNQTHNVEMFAKNLALQSVPLKVAAKYGVKHFLQVSSVCVYAPEHTNPCKELYGHEGQPIPANAGYSWAKRMGEKLAGWYIDQYDMRVIIVRPSNVYGPRDYFLDRPHVIPALIYKCLYDDEVVVNGDGKVQREFIYVKDVARGMVAAIEHGKFGHAYNLGTNGETKISIAELIVFIQHVTGVQDKPVVFKDLFDSGDSIRWSDCSKANTILNWRHKVGLDKGLRNTVEWYKRQ